MDKTIIHIDDEMIPRTHPNPDPPPHTYDTIDIGPSYDAWVEEMEERDERRRSLEPNPHIIHEGMEFI